MSSIAALRLVTARAAPAGRRAMGGGTATRPRPLTRGAPPSLQHVRWTAHFRSATLGRPARVENGARRRTFHAPRRRRRDCFSTENERPRPAQFDGKPFNKGSMAASVIATVAGGAGVICFAAFFQNKKHGFIK